MQGTPTIRLATDADLPALRKLAPAAKELGPRLATIPGRRYTLVLDAPDGDEGPGHDIAAAAVLELDARRGHLVLLAIAERFHGDGLENRLIGVAEAMCSAFHCDTLDVPAARPARAA